MGTCVVASRFRFFCSLAAVLWLSLYPFPAKAQKIEASASLHGTVRDSSGTGAAGATVSLQAQDTKQSQTVPTDAHGNYRFAALAGGAYVLRAAMTGYNDATIPSLFFGPKEEKTADLILTPVKTQKIQPAVPEFFDEPRFAVAGVTDSTNLGGHGSS